MATFELNIRCGNIDEFSEIAARLCGYETEAEEPRGLTAADMGQPQSDTEGGEAPAKPKRTRKAKAGAEPTQQPSGEPIPPTTEPKPQPTPGGTEAPPAESIPPKQEPAKDVFAAGAETASATPSASSPEADAAAAAGEPTMQQLKDAMAELLKVKSAAFAMKTLEDATGCKSLSSGSPSVAEKAKTEPAIMRTALYALVAGKTAA